MIETTAMAHVNMYGVLGTLENLCQLDNEAQAILAKLKKPVSLCFSVKNGPCCTFHFSREGCRMTEGDAGCTCKMSFASPEAFNNLIDHSKPGIPTKNPVQVISFLLGPFTQLTDRLNTILRPTEEAMKDRGFFEKSTTLTLYTIAGAISALANNDSISKISADYTVDGDISLGIKDTAYITLRVENKHFTTIKERCENPRAIMEFADLDLAAGLFAGKVSTINEMCKGTIRLRGMISMLDNVNRILDRVSVYLG
ncbi:MAG: hypothetical protein IKY46_07670 [Clostridia bacterium]|nr:hypothetical protein [Clostridia bacterium]